VAPGKAAELRAAAREVMCRTRRVETAIAFAPRTVDTYMVPADAREATLMRTVTAYLRAFYRRGLAAYDTVVGEAGQARGRSRASRAVAGSSAAGQPTPTAAGRGALIREIVALQQSLSSSPQAIAVSLRQRAEKHPDEGASLLEMAALADGLRGSKEQLLLEALQQLGSEPALIFTLRLETARHLRAAIRASGRTAECYLGELTHEERCGLVAMFNRGKVGTLIATDAGAEGLNLQQRCRIVFNYDLHWNPMKMEQRIGRVHRLGQTRPVRVVNFALRDSIDEYVLRLLYEKIDLFSMTIGALEGVLADVQDGELDWEERILDVLLREGAEDNDQVRAGVEDLGGQLAEARCHQHDAEELTQGVLG
jgi:hypothetical protein